MANLLPGRTPPFEVAVGPHPFVDYRFVHAGQPRWLDADGKAIHYWDSPEHACRHSPWHRSAGAIGKSVGTHPHVY